MSPKKIFLALAGAMTLFTTIPARADAGLEAKPPVAVVSILPQQYFVQRISEGRFRLLVLVGPGQNPHSYEPSPRQMADLGSAALWLRIGVDFEKGLLPKVSSLYPGLPIVDTTEGVRFRSMDAHDHEEAGHAEQDSGEGVSAPDPHIWLGRDGAKIQAVRIRDALSSLDPPGAEFYAVRCQALIRDIDAAFDALSVSLAPLRGKSVFVYHPAFGYFLDEFGIRQVAVEVGGKEPTQKSLAELINRARKEGARVVFVQPQFSRSAAKAVADAIGGVVVEISDLDADWLESIKRTGEALRTAIR